jgi:hypothetical protein
MSESCCRDKNKGSSLKDKSNRNSSASSSKQNGSSSPSSNNTNSPSYSTAIASSSRKPRANVVIDDSDDEVEGAWSVVTMDQSYMDGYDEDDDMPELESVTKDDIVFGAHRRT